MCSQKPGLHAGLIWRWFPAVVLLQLHIQSPQPLPAKQQGVILLWKRRLCKRAEAGVLEPELRPEIADEAGFPPRSAQLVKLSEGIVDKIAHGLPFNAY